MDRIIDNHELARRLRRGPVSVAGADVTGSVEGTIDDPSDGSVLAEARWADTAGAREGLEQAKRAAIGWAATPVEQRVELLRRLAHELDARAQAFVLAESVDTGKPLVAARRAVATAAEGLRAYSPGDLPDSGEIEHWEPLGTACAILPANAALFTAGIRAGAALVAGCTLVLKPPPEAALSVTMLAELALEVGFPPGVLVSIPGGADVGAALLEGRPDLVLFTGGRAAGLEVASVAGSMGVPVRLELGGGAMVIVAPDADAERVVEGLMMGTFGNQGQVCVSARIIRVAARSLDRFTERFVAGAQALRVGPAVDAATTFGPLQTAQRVAEMEALAHELSGVACGAKRPENPSLPPGGYYFSPTVVQGLPPNPGHEVFGPFAFIAPYDDLEAVVEEVNATTSGLAAGVWGTPETAMAIGSRLRVGQVYINRHFNPTAGLTPGEPWGRSGVGRSGPVDHLRVRRLFLP